VIRIVRWFGPFIVALLLAPSQPADVDKLGGLIDLLASVDDSDLQRDLLQGLREGLRGRAKVVAPRGWPAAYAKLAKSPSLEVRRHATALALTFGDEAVRAALEQTLADAEAAADERSFALAALLEAAAPGLAPRLIALVEADSTDANLRRAAIRGLARYDDAAAPRALLARYPKLDAPARADAIATLASRPAYALALLDAVEKEAVDGRDISAVTARALLNLRDENVRARLKEVWGEVRETAKDKRALFARYRDLLVPGRAAGAGAGEAADASRGRAVYDKTCKQCHTLFGEGAAIGPDLTGSNRANLDYVLENVIDPNAVVGKGYLLVNAILKDGQVVAGIVKEESGSRVTIQTTSETVVLGRERILELVTTEQSMMPEGLFEKLSDAEVRDLVKYLASPVQVEVPEGTPTREGEPAGGGAKRDG
jgi:putative heme-binding domain-containing protein